MNLKHLTSITLIFIALFMAGCGEKEKKEQTGTQIEAKESPVSFTLKEDNRTISAKLEDGGFLFSVEEPVVMLDFFATWCPPCRAEIPHLANLQKKYAGKLKIIGVLVESKHPAELKRFVEGHGINYFVSNAPDNMLIAATTADMLHQPKNFSIPMMVLFVNGKYFRHYIGMVPEEMLESDIKEALKEVK
ncbi:TlpA family protein disulfide reductase [Hydrogenimonas cancrithermarum]|uniref:Thioredoxin n=1 Tax=Hydrogenimonas cancrithermarum TaxID=2993563 RepID=A0ABM8FL48_9BACT|nr:TlpA disulfide reductase family protein [Hydrogenimonas cancrithermarum]BDY12143.1 thioredoxin [Hydrogenimonas cancrithermarum]